ncbi:MAG: elongation factor G [Deltaproteobacteria bacterium]|nr:MAG: elongation factor G [Deltaproteobacteria bacterium]
MRKVDIEKVRNVAIIAHGGAGKTTLAEALLFAAGATERMGKVDDGTSNFDVDPEEIKRKITISTSFNVYTWNKHEVTVADTPGYINFEADAKNTLRVVEGAILVINGVSGVEVQTEKMWKYAKAENIPVLGFVSKLDRERADFDKVLDEVKEVLEVTPVPVFYPIGKEAEFTGVVDLLKKKAYIYDREGSGKFEEGEIPPDMEETVSTMVEALVEGVAESDDALLEKYLEEGELSEDEVRSAFSKAVREGLIFPIFCGAPLKLIGVHPFLDYINDLIPSPLAIGEVKGRDPKSGDEIARKVSPDEPFSGQVFKTLVDPYAGKLSLIKIYSGTLTAEIQPYNPARDATERIGQILKPAGKKHKQLTSAVAGEIIGIPKFKETLTGDTLCDPKNPIIYDPPTFDEPVISFAIKPKSRSDEDKLGPSLARLMEEDPTLKFGQDPQTKEFILSGMGEIHLEVAVEKLKRQFGVEVELRTPKVPYKETIKKKVEVQGKYKKQTGGRGQYGDTWLRIEPLERGKGFEFHETIVGGVVPKQYIPAVEKGVVEAMKEGVLAGYPVTDVKVTLYDGSYHPVDSSEMAFKIAASMGFKKGMEQANPVLLEPILELEVICPEENVGDVIGDLNSKRGRVLGVEAHGRNQVVKALVPMAEVLKYSSDLRALTSGRGVFTMKFSHYEEAPQQIAEKVIEEARREREGESEE